MSSAPEAGVPVGPIIGWKRWPAVGAWPLHVYGEVGAKLVRLSELPSAAGIHRFWEPDPATYTPEVLTKGVPILPEEAEFGRDMYFDRGSWGKWELGPVWPMDLRAEHAWLRPHASKAAPVVDAEHFPEGYRLAVECEKRIPGYLIQNDDGSWTPNADVLVGEPWYKTQRRVAIPLDPALALVECGYPGMVDGVVPSVGTVTTDGVLPANSALVEEREPISFATEKKALRDWLRYSPESPNPGMVAAFEMRFGVDWNEPTYGCESAVWAEAWKYATSPAPDPRKRIEELDEVLRWANEVRDRCDHQYKQIDALHAWPNSYEGDVLRMVYNRLLPSVRAALSKLEGQA